jgi:carbon storage regulator
MLVLTRKPGEQVLIGDDIQLTVVSVHGKRVRLGIAAPANLPILRIELCRPEDRPSGFTMDRTAISLE